MLFWKLYNYVAGVFVLSQVIFIVQAFNNLKYAFQEFRKQRRSYRPKTLLTVPCKGIDRAFEKNIASFFLLDYDNYILSFVVDDVNDPAYAQLMQLKQKLSGQSHASEIRILVSGPAQGCSQKIHNLLYSCRNAPEDVEVFAFADSDACVKPYWLSHLVHPLRKQKKGATTGYRWFVPLSNNLATVALSALNAKIAQLLGNTHFNQAWGGSMAIRVDTFKNIGLDELWQNAVSDDLSLSYAVKKAGMKVIFVPACVVASYERMNWRQVFEFGRRQFVITRIYVPATWWFGLISSIYSLLGLWGGLAMAIVATATGAAYHALFYIVPALFAAGQFYRAILRQIMVRTLLPEEAEKLRMAAVADILGNLLFSWVLLACILSSARGRVITWRGIRYRLISPTKTQVLNLPS